MRFLVLLAATALIAGCQTTTIERVNSTPMTEAEAEAAIAR